MNKLIMLCALALFAFCASTAFAQNHPPLDPTPTTGVPGVKDGSCWKNHNGDVVKVSVRGTVHGDQDVTFTEGTNTGSATGTPDPDGGCAECSATSCGDESYRIRNGRMQNKNSNGTWVKMRKTKCDKAHFAVLEA